MMQKLVCTVIGKIQPFHFVPLLLMLMGFHLRESLCVDLAVGLADSLWIRELVHSLQAQHSRGSSVVTPLPEPPGVLPWQHEAEVAYFPRHFNKLLDFLKMPPF